MSQRRAWYDQQAKERNARLNAEKRDTELLGKTLRMYDQLQMEIAGQEAAIRREMNKTTQDTNIRFAEEKKLRQMQQKEAELRANIAEMQATVNSPLMCEDPAQATSRLSDTRVSQALGRRIV